MSYNHRTAASAAFMLSGLLLAGCAQMPAQTSADATLAQKNLQETTHLLHKQHQLDLATDAVANKLDHVQHVINQRIRNHEPLIQKKPMLKSIRVTLPNAPCQTQIVRPGESLSGIATRYHVTLAQLQRWNGITNPNLVRIGQKLQVTACHKKG